MEFGFTAFTDWKNDLKRYKNNLKKSKPLLDERDVVSTIRICYNFGLPFLAGYLGVLYSKWFFIIGLPVILFDLKFEEKR